MERSVRLERSCAEDEEVSEEGRGARWHGTYEYPRQLQQWGEGSEGVERREREKQNSIVMGTTVARVVFMEHT